MPSNGLRASQDAKRIKISMIGNMAVGKTCLSLRFVRDLFREEHKSTISDIESKVVVVNEQDVVFQIWDTAGQERFRSLLPLYLKGIDGAVIAYDVTDRATYDSVTVWLNEVRKYSSTHTVLALAGNKKDKLPDRQVTTQEARAFAREQGLMFQETSAKTGDAVDRLFVELGQEILRRQSEPQQDVYKHATVDMSNPPRNKCQC